MIRPVSREKEVAPQSEPLLYNEAVLYCYTCTHAGHYDWRPFLDLASGRPTFFIAVPWRPKDNETHRLKDITETL